MRGSSGVGPQAPAAPAADALTPTAGTAALTPSSGPPAATPTAGSPVATALSGSATATAPAGSPVATPSSGPPAGAPLEAGARQAPGPSVKAVVSGFGPTALATPANAVTAARLLAAPVVVLMVAVAGPSWPAFAVGVLVAASDGFDGWLARRQGPTRSGAFIDPLADKVVVLGVLGAVAARGEIEWLPVALIAAREVSMSIYRWLMARRGVSIPARRSAKVKTLVQLTAGGLCLMPPLAAHHVLLDAVVWLAVALTVVSGTQYLLDGRRAADMQPATAGGGTPS